MGKHSITTHDLQRGIRTSRAEDVARRWIESTAPHWGATVRSTPPVTPPPLRAR